MLYCGRCNNHLLLADVIAKCVMTDVIAKCVMADVFAKYVMADVVTICVKSGMRSSNNASLKF